MKKIECSNIMKMAWRIAKEGAIRFGGKAREYFSHALKQSWNIFKKINNRVFNYENYAISFKVNNYGLLKLVYVTKINGFYSIAKPVCEHSDFTIYDFSEKMKENCVGACRIWGISPCNFMPVMPKITGIRIPVKFRNAYYKYVLDFMAVNGGIFE